MRNSARTIIHRGSMTDRGQAERIVSFMEALQRPVGAPNERLNKLFDIATEAPHRTDRGRTKNQGAKLGDIS